MSLGVCSVEVTEVVTEAAVEVTAAAEGTVVVIPELLTTVTLVAVIRVADHKFLGLRGNFANARDGFAGRKRDASSSRTRRFVLAGSRPSPFSTTNSVVSTDPRSSARLNGA